MSELKIDPPQPIPYPNNIIIKKLYQTPILLYRLGLGKLIGKYILILSTFGRKTGRIHRTPVEYFQDQDRLFVISGFGTAPDWFRNLQTDPHVTLNLGEEHRNMLAYKPQTKQEWDGVLAYLKSSPVSVLSNPGLIHQLDKPEIQQVIKTWPVLTFKPTQDPCPPPLEADLVWAWPFILILLAIKLLVGWMIIHSEKR